VVPTCKPKRMCPKCGDSEVVAIRYGLHPPDALPSDGTWVDGGCWVDQSPDWACKACGAQWRARPGTSAKSRRGDLVQLGYAGEGERVAVEPTGLLDEIAVPARLHAEYRGIHLVKFLFRL